MSNKLTGQLKIINTHIIGTAELSSPTDKVEIFESLLLNSGIGAGNAEDYFSDQRTLNASANEELDLSGGLTNAFGVSLTFTKVKALYVKAATGNTNNVLVGGAATNAFVFGNDATDKLILPPGGIFFLYDPSSGGRTVTAGTGDLLRMENSAGGTSVTYDLVIVGETS